MAGLTQKQIAEKYKGNLNYFKKPHYLRQLRGWCFVAAVVVSLLGAATFPYWGPQSFLSTGPMTQNHAAFANDCRVCHLDAESGGTSQAGQNRTVRSSNASSVRDSSPVDTLLSATALSLMDRACLQCHPKLGVHQPQSAGLALRTAANEFNVVHASGCAACHREHVGPEPMPLPDREVCAACHNNTVALQHARRFFKPTPVAATSGKNHDFDGLIRFIAPPKPAGSLKPFASYAEGHPPFAYEQSNVRDPGTLKFNHARHARADIPQVKNRKLECSDCHEAGPGGVFHQPVRYDKHCQQCHSLQIQPTLPNVVIPHGDPEKVRYFLASLEDVAFEKAVRAGGVSDPVQASKRAEAERDILRQRGLRTLDDLEQRVFFEGDPRDDPSDRLRSGGSRKFLTECAKCHGVSPGTTDHAPTIDPPNVAQRWVQRGPFTHLPHQHVSCVDCHEAATKSKLTSDILLPPQKLCTECHRPPVVKGRPDWETLKSGGGSAGSDLAAAQRHAGGARWDCISCHVFHAPANTTDVTQASPPPSSSALLPTKE